MTRSSSSPRGGVSSSRLVRCLQVLVILASLSCSIFDHLFAVTFSRLAGGDEAHGKAGVHCALKKRRRPGARWRHFGRGARPGARPCGSWSLGRPCEKPGAARYCLLLLLPHVWSSPGGPPRLELARAEACGALPGARPGAICREEQRSGAAGRSRGLEPAASSGGGDARKERITREREERIANFSIV
ncbi:uncharacterized protein [Aegilops tauschii subsp. strangulata]|uniref:uncharacterized protein n=1 Tax=Aegilops tauschii subsp. strangulata TaxID=200361 RepID=UPI003CC8D08C